MKITKLISSNFFLVLFIFWGLSFSLNAQPGSFKVREDGFIQVGYNGINKAITFGGNALNYANHANGLIGLEYWSGGLNAFVPWPAYGAGNYKLFVRQSNGHVGIGKYPVHKLDVNGSIAINGTVMLSSDKRLKTNITPLDGLNSLSAINTLKTYTYQYKNKELPITYDDEQIENADPNKKKTIQADLGRTSEKSEIRTGFIAQEVSEVIPNLVSKDDDGRYTIDYLGLIPILIAAFQEQNKTLVEMQLEIKKLTTELEQLKRK